MTVLEKTHASGLRKILVTLTFGGCLIAGLTGCGNPGQAPGEKIDIKTPVAVTIPVYKSISDTLDFQAVSTYLRRNVLRSSTTGSVETTSVSLGDFVRKGDQLFTIITREALALQQSRVKDTSLVFKGLINITSPDDGVISSISHQNGDYVQEGDELAVLSDIRSLVFLLEVPFEMTKHVEKNRICILELPDNTKMNGRIQDRLPEMNIQNQTVRYIVITDRTRHFPENLIASASVVKNEKIDAQVLPKSAILGNETQTEFWIMKLINDSTAVKIPVKKGIENFDEVEIIDPSFLPSDKILVSGNYGLPDTALVIVNR